MLARKRKTLLSVSLGLPLVCAVLFGAYYFAVRPVFVEAEMEAHQLANISHADPNETTAAFVFGHEHGPDHPTLTNRVVRNPNHVRLLLAAAKWTIEHGSRDRWSHYFHSHRLTLRGPSFECALWLATDRSGWSFAENPDAWYGGGYLLHLVFGVVYLADGPSESMYVTLKDYVSLLRYFSSEELDGIHGFLVDLAPLVIEIEKNPDTPLSDFWTLTKLPREKWLEEDSPG